MDARELARAVRWPALAESAIARGRTPVIDEVAARYEPVFGDLSSRAARRLTSTVEQALEGTFVVPLHSTEPQYARGMLTDGFRWKRWRDVDGYEPYEDKLGEWGALGAGERSEDFIFTELRVLPGDATLGHALARDSLRSRAHQGGGSTTGYGAVTLAFDPRTLGNATMLPAISTLPFFGSRAATIEHLPSMLASRLAGDFGYMAEVEANGHRFGGRVDLADLVLGRAPASQARLGRLLAAPEAERVARVRGLLTSDPEAGMRGRGNPAEGHVRSLTPADIVRVDVEAPFAVVGPPDRSSRRMTRTTEGILGALHSRHGAALLGLNNVLEPGQLATIEAAVRELHVPLGGATQQRRMLELARASERRLGPPPPLAAELAPAESPGPSLGYAIAPVTGVPRELRDGIHFIEDSPDTTAAATTALRRRMAAARAAAEA